MKIEELFSNLLLLVIFSLVLNGENYPAITINVEGYGTTPIEAEKNALQKAVRKAIGEFVDTESIAQNGELIKDEVLTYSDGFVESKKILSGPEKDEDLGFYVVSMEAVVVSKKLVERLKDSKISLSNMSGENMWASSISKITGAKDGRAILSKFLTQELLPERLVNAQLISHGPDETVLRNELAKPIQKPDYDNDSVELSFQIELSYDLSAFFEQAIPRLNSILDKISTRVLDKSAPIKISKNFVPAGSSSIINGSPSIHVQRDPFLHFSRGYGLKFCSWKSDDIAEFDTSSNYIYLATLLASSLDKSTHRFRIYQLDRNAYKKIIETAPARILPSLHISLESENSLIRKETIQLKDAMFTDRRRNFPLSFNYLTVSKERELWKKNNLNSNQQFVCGPIFKSNRREPICYTIAPWLLFRDKISPNPVIVHKISLKNEELKNLDKVSFSWEQK